MKIFAIVLLCALAAVQGRYTGLQTTSGSGAALGENPWFVHLRIAVSTSGLLETCAGTLINSITVITAGHCVQNARFIWIRYGVVKVSNPSLVTENTVFNYDFFTGVGYISTGRWLDPTPNFAPIPLIGEIGDSGRYCAFGGEDGPGEVLNCYDVNIAPENGGYSVTGDVKATQYDLGAPLVSNGVLVGVLIGSGPESSVGYFVPKDVFMGW